MSFIFVAFTAIICEFIKKVECMYGFIRQGEQMLQQDLPREQMLQQDLSKGTKCYFHRNDNKIIRSLLANHLKHKAYIVIVIE